VGLAYTSSGFWNTEIKELCLDFTLPGYPDYTLPSKSDDLVVSALVFENRFRYQFLWSADLQCSLSC